MCVLNRIDRFHLAITALDLLPHLRDAAAHAREQLKNTLIAHRQYIRRHGEDMPEIRNWRWNAPTDDPCEAVSPVQDIP